MKRSKWIIAPLLVFLSGCLFNTDDTFEGRSIFGEDVVDMSASDGLDTSDGMNQPDLVTEPDLPPEDLCKATQLDCGDFGRCAVFDGEAACVCEEGYRGAACDTCAEGFQDNDGDGICDRGCQLAALDCGNGVCDDSEGVTECICDTGYTGVACDTCASGYQDNDGDNTCAPACSLGSLDCGADGTCDDTSGVTVCDCDEGIAGDTCGMCAAGFQDNDSDGTCLPDCATAQPDCGQGACDDSAGQTECVCDNGYAGAGCDVCDTGFQDKDGDGVCAPDCASAVANGLVCGNGVCDDASGEALCACDTGYAGDVCETCATGYQDNNSDGECLQDCMTANLGCINGACADDSGEALCACDAGYDGATCDTCATGFQDNDTDGTCSEDCSTTQLTCVATAQCDDSSGTAACVCLPEYAEPTCDTCAAGYQDNDNDGTCKATCATANLTCMATETCSDESGEARCVGAPASCTQAQFFGATDGLVELFVDNDPAKPWDAFCVDMGTNAPRAYLPLRKTSEESNRFQYYNDQGLVAETDFWMVRIDPITLQINVQDFTGSRTVYYQEMSTEQVPFASVLACTTGDPGVASSELVARGKADFTNTPFKLNPVNLVPNRECGFPTYDVNDDFAAISVWSQSSTPGACAGVAIEAFRSHYGYTDCGGTVLTTPDPNTPIDWIGQLYYRGTTSRVRDYPANCLEHKFLDATSTDGDYTLYLDGDPTKPWLATCLGMGDPIPSYVANITDPDVRRTGPREYINLTNPDPDSNVHKQGGTFSYPVRSEATYTKIRFDPRTYDVDIQDKAFASLVAIDPSTSSSAPNDYGTVGSCSDNCCGGSYPGLAKLDLRGTPLKFNDAFIIDGFCASGTVTSSFNDQVYNLDGDGQCGGAVPIRRDAGDGCFGRPDPHYSENDFVLQLAPL